MIEAPAERLEELVRELQVVLGLEPVLAQEIAWEQELVLRQRSAHTVLEQQVVLE